MAVCVNGRVFRLLKYLKAFYVGTHKVSTLQACTLMLLFSLVTAFSFYPMLLPLFR
nr:MAG TPA: hypothetical protein [Caudoviricetes sp.]